MNIILIGLRGSGKTTIGKLLAQKLSIAFIDCDHFLENRSSRKITQIVKDDGWEKFRDLEEEILQQILCKRNVVIATGGGVVERQINRKRLKKNGRVIWLNAPIETLVRRIGNDTNRPALTTKKSLLSEMQEVLNKRKKLYQQTAQIVVDTNRTKPERLVKTIMKHL